VCSSDLIDIIRAASEAKPKEGVPLSDSAREDWTKFVAKHGDEFSVLYYPSFNDTAENIVKALLK
jgi:hypothetical protein